jgi:uncharacterized protein (TIGR03086 family)
MTTTTKTPALTDPRAVFGAAVTTATPVIAAVRPDQLDGPTPCPALDVRLLVEHLVMVLDRVATIGRGEPPFSTTWTGAGVADDGWLDAWRAKVAEVETAWADDAALDRTVVLPWATQPGSAALVMYTGELSVHTWDLAVATGRQPAWNEAALAPALAWIMQGLPAEGRQAAYDEVRAEMDANGQASSGPFDGPPFGEVVAVPDDAPLIDRLVAWQGRDPGWTP